MSIYVPDALKAAMDRLGDDDRANWSAAAQEAFERLLERLSRPREVRMDQVVERLRASKEQFQRDQMRAGRERGEDWAMHEASFEALRALAGVDPKADRNGVPLRSMVDKQLGITIEAESLFFNPPAPWPSDEYVAAFVEGAKSVWLQVADKI
jgi:hypothetical protein